MLQSGRRKVIHKMKMDITTVLINSRKINNNSNNDNNNLNNNNNNLNNNNNNLNNNNSNLNNNSNNNDNNNDNNNNNKTFLLFSGQVVGQLRSSVEAQSTFPKHDFCLIENFINEEEEVSLVKQIEQKMKKMPYSDYHFDSVIKHFRELSIANWNQNNTDILQRVWSLLYEQFPNRSWLPSHVIDLNHDGFIRPHLDHLSVCFSFCLSFSLLSFPFLFFVFSFFFFLSFFSCFLFVFSLFFLCVSFS